MRGLGALTLFSAFRFGAAHPLCYIDDRATDYNEVLTFCPAQQAGACCTDAEELAVVARFEVVGTLTGDCEDLYRQARARVVEAARSCAFGVAFFPSLGRSPPLQLFLARAREIAASRMKTSLRVRTTPFMTCVLTVTVIDRVLCAGKRKKHLAFRQDLFAANDYSLPSLSS